MVAAFSVNLAIPRLIAIVDSGVPSKKVNPDGFRGHHLLVHIQRLGDDMFEDVEGERFTFTHNMVNIPFEYNVAQVDSKDDLTSK